MSEASERWLARELAWVDEQLAAIEAKDEAAFERFMAGLLAD
ncbi:hypothetical protein [Paraburkholderia atlantica]|nr:hypothetical protein [Paraburkholderia atlantica]MBB5414057.1 hypothetical protein [Paraburkholderia atlantica]